MKRNQPFEVATPPAACTTRKCTSNEDEDQLQCRQCKRYVHYECSQLSLYPSFQSMSWLPPMKIFKIETLPLRLFFSLKKIQKALKNHKHFVYF